MHWILADFGAELLKIHEFLYNGWSIKNRSIDEKIWLIDKKIDNNKIGTGWSNNKW